MKCSFATAATSRCTKNVITCPRWQLAPILPWYNIGSNSRVFCPAIKLIQFRDYQAFLAVKTKHILFWSQNLTEGSWRKFLLQVVRSTDTPRGYVSVWDTQRVCLCVRLRYPQGVCLCVEISSEGMSMCPFEIPPEGYVYVSFDRWMLHDFLTDLVTSVTEWLVI